MCTTQVQGLQRPEEVIRSLELELQLAAPYGCWEQTPGPLQEQQELFNCRVISPTPSFIQFKTDYLLLTYVCSICPNWLENKFIDGRDFF